VLRRLAAVVEVDMHPTTTRNLMRALEREAVAAARMTAYARRADQDGDPDAAQTLRAIARSDLDDAADMAELLGWVGSLHENVLACVVGDATTPCLDYATLAGEARKAGDEPQQSCFGGSPPTRRRPRSGSSPWPVAARRERRTVTCTNRDLSRPDTSNR
jgi:hypothetical protein